MMDFDDVLHWVGIGLLMCAVFCGVFAIAVCIVTMIPK